MTNILKYKNEILLSIYLVIFSLIRPILINNTNNSTLILTITTGVLIAVWLLLEIINKKTILISPKHLIFIMSIYFLLFCESLFRKNDMLVQIIYKFTIYGAIPILLCSKVDNYKKMLLYYAFFSIVNGIIYFFEPLNNYIVSGDYMSFGFNQMLPAFTGSIILFNIFRKKYALILAICFFVQMFLYANKGATICAICIVLISYLFFNKKKKIVLKKMLFITCIIIIVLFNMNTIINNVIRLIKDMNMNTYSLTTFLDMLQNNGNNVYYVRTDLWQDAIQLFLNKPILGNGIGYFESNFNGYTHNFFLDIAVSSGIIGLIMIITALIYSIKKIIKTKEEYKRYFLIILFVISFIPMMFSLTYWTVMTFWLYFAIIFCSKEENKYVDGEKNESINRKL